MPQLLLLAGGTVIAFKLLASGAEDAGQAIDIAGNGALKLAIAAGATFLVLKKAKVL